MTYYRALRLGDIVMVCDLYLAFSALFPYEHTQA
jgi:hypothetical protein